MTHVVKEAFDIGVADPVRFTRRDDTSQSGQGIVTGLLGAITVRGVVKVHFVDPFQDHHNRALDKLVFHARDTKGTRFPIPLGDVLTQAWVAADRRRDEDGREDREASLGDLLRSPRS